MLCPDLLTTGIAVKEENYFSHSTKFDTQRSKYVVYCNRIGSPKPYAVQAFIYHNAKALLH